MTSISSLTIVLCLLYSAAALSMKHAVISSESIISSSRRAFLSKVTLTTAGTTVGIFSHVNSCSCGSCSFRFGPNAANAEPTSKDTNNIQLSPDWYAQDLEAKRTLSRLERGGFKLDTNEEQTVRLNDALSSFSYDSAMSSKKKGTSEPQSQVRVKEQRKN